MFEMPTNISFMLGYGLDLWNRVWVSRVCVNESLKVPTNINYGLDLCKCDWVTKGLNERGSVELADVTTTSFKLGDGKV